MMQVLFAPDFRQLAPYQAFLAEALRAQGVSIEFAEGYRRVMPLYRTRRGRRCDLLHPHWPIHYFAKRDRLDLLRKLRFLPDLLLATSGTKLVYTVHDLMPIEGPRDWIVRWDMHGLLQRADRLIAHSPQARKAIVEQFGVNPEKCAVIPHGDQAAVYGEPLPRAEARAALNLPEGKVCLAFGRVEPGKGIEELVRFWNKAQPPCMLAIVGSARAAAHARMLQDLIGDNRAIVPRFAVQSDHDVRLWFSAADVALINYREIFTSGVACLARSYGIPTLIGQRLSTVGLLEPDPLVLRFESVQTYFAGALEQALRLAPDYSHAEPYRRATAWESVAAATLDLYRAVLE